MKLNHAEIVVLMRSLTRSLEKTPEYERVAHQRIYSRLAQASVESLPPKLVAKVGRAIDRQIGRDR